MIVFLYPKSHTRPVVIQHRAPKCPHPHGSADESHYISAWVHYFATDVEGIGIDGLRQIKIDHIELPDDPETADEVYEALGVEHPGKAILAKLREQRNGGK